MERKGDYVTCPRQANTAQGISNSDPKFFFVPVYDITTQVIRLHEALKWALCFLTQN